MAYEHIEHGQKKPDQYDFSRVISCYHRFGDVWGSGYEDWWYARARALLETPIQPRTKLLSTVLIPPMLTADDLDLHHLRVQNAPAEDLAQYFLLDHEYYGFPDIAVLAVPLNGNKRQIKKQANQIIDQAIASLPKPARKKTRVRFSVNKIRRITMEKYLFAVREKAEYGHKLFALGNAINQKFSQTRVTPSIPCQRDLESQTSALLKKALNVAEWAARGEFPKASNHEMLTVARYKGPTHYKISFYDTDFIRYQIALGNICLL